MRTGIAIFFLDKVSFLKHPNVHTYYKVLFLAPETNLSTQFFPQSSGQGHLATTEAEDKVWQRQDWGNHSWKNQDQTLSFFWGGEGGDYKDIIKEVITMLMFDELYISFTMPF